MTQEQLLDHVAKLVTNACKSSEGLILLMFKNEFHTLRLPEKVDIDEVCVHVFNAQEIAAGLPPSTWLTLSKKLWTLYSTHAKTIKFPKQTAAAAGKPERKPNPSDEPPKAG